MAQFIFAAGMNMGVQMNLLDGSTQSYTLQEGTKSWQSAVFTGS